MAISDEDALKVGRKVLRAMGTSSRTTTLTKQDLAVTQIKVKVPTGIIGSISSTLTGALSLTHDPTIINADPTDSGITDSDPMR